MANIAYSIIKQSLTCFATLLWLRPSIMGACWFISLTVTAFYLKPFVGTLDMVFHDSFDSDLSTGNVMFKIQFWLFVS